VVEVPLEWDRGGSQYRPMVQLVGNPFFL
jgi:hypothetical protein